MVKRILLLILLGMVIGLTGFLLFLGKRYADVVVTPLAKVVAGSQPSPTPDPDAPFTILLLGYGGGTHEGGLLTDTIIALRVNPKKKTAALISIPRDLWIQLPVSSTGSTAYKINHAYAIGADDRLYPNKPVQYQGRAGGGELAKYAINQVLGFPADHFVAVSFAGFTKSIDVLGGVDVHVAKTFDDYYYPIDGREDDACGRTTEDVAALTATLSGELLEHEFPCRFEHLHFDRGLTHMDGTTALKFVRSRHSLQDGTDFGRAQRQQALLAAVRDKVLSIGFLPKMIPFISTLTGDMQTDITLDTGKKYLPEAYKAASYKVISIALTTDNVLVEGRSADGQYILNPKAGEFNFSGIHTYIASQLAGATPSATLSPSR